MKARSPVARSERLRLASKAAWRALRLGLSVVVALLVVVAFVLTPSARRPWSASALAGEAGARPGVSTNPSATSVTNHDVVWLCLRRLLCSWGDPRSGW